MAGLTKEDLHLVAYFARHKTLDECSEWNRIRAYLSNEHPKLHHLVKALQQRQVQMDTIRDKIEAYADEFWNQEELKG